MCVFVGFVYTNYGTETLRAGHENQVQARRA